MKIRTFVIKGFADALAIRSGVYLFGSFGSCQIEYMSPIGLLGDDHDGDKKQEEDVEDNQPLQESIAGEEYDS